MIQGLQIYLVLVAGLLLQVPQADLVNVQNLLEARTLPRQYHCAAHHIAHCAKLKQRDTLATRGEFFLKKSAIM